MTDPQPERDLTDDDDATSQDVDGAQESSGPQGATSTLASGSRRLIVLIGASLLLLAIGAGMATMFAPNPGASAAATAPANATASTADIPTPSVPTALPLPQAIGDVTSTDPVAQVGAVTITRGDFVRAYQPGDPPSEVLTHLIQIELIVQQASVQGIEADQSKIDAEIAQLKEQNSITNDADFLALLQKNNLASEDELRGLIARSLLIDQVMLAHTPVEQAHARHILLAATEDKVEARKAEAEALFKQLQDGADFAQLASEKSEDPGSKENGGDLGWAPRGMFVTEFDDAVFSMKKDELRLVKTQFGWHIIQLLDLPEVRPLESSDMLNTTSGQQAFNDVFLPWLKQIQTDAEAAQKVKILVTDDQLVTQPGA